MVLPKLIGVHPRAPRCVRSRHPLRLPVFRYPSTSSATPDDGEGAPSQLEDFKARKAAAAAQSRAAPLLPSQAAASVNGDVSATETSGTPGLSDLSRASSQSDKGVHGDHSRHGNGDIGVPKSLAESAEVTNICCANVDLNQQEGWLVRRSSKPRHLATRRGTHDTRS